MVFPAGAHKEDGLCLLTQVLEQDTHIDEGASYNGFGVADGPEGSGAIRGGEGNLFPFEVGMEKLGRRISEVEAWDFLGAAFGGREIA
jgi:hypothetical protein